LKGKANQVPVIAPQMIVEKESKPSNSKPSGTFPDFDFAFIPKNNDRMNNKAPYPPSPKIIAKKREKNTRKEKLISYSR